PSMPALEDLARLLQGIYSGFDVEHVRETTIEVNPEDASEDYLSGIKSLGFDRLSIGIQSFYASDLEFMNRSHSAEQAESAVENAKKVGFENISVDLIFGLPDQPEEYWYANFEKVVRMEIPHVSTYNLTVEERTPLAKMVQRGIVQPPPEEEWEERYVFTMKYLREHGYEHYEISSFAKPGMRSLHNQVYWSHRNYLGLGPSAHSFWWRGLPAQRWYNERNLRRYEALLHQHTLPLGGREHLSLDQLANEYILLRLRTSDGLDLGHFESRYGVDLLFEKADEIAELEGRGYIQLLDGRRLSLTDEGKLLCDAITTRLLLD